LKTLWDYNLKVNIKKDKNLGNTYTHPYISNQIIKNLINLKKDYKNILEPCVGLGSFYYSIINNLKVEKVTCFDIDINSISLIEKRKKDIFKIEDFLLSKFNKNYDLIITNPPYISYNNIYSKKLEKSEYIKKIKKNINFKKLGITDKEIDKKSLSQLDNVGKLIFLCSDKWLDSNYGMSLKKILLNNYKLETIITSNYYPFFKDDTNAIITIISKRDKNEFLPTKVYSITNPTFELKNPYIFTYKEINDIFLYKDLNINNKNKLLFYQKEYKITESFLNKNKNKNKNKFVKLSNILEIRNSSITFNNLFKNNKIQTKKKDENIILFYQKQARLNKPANYKQKILFNELKFYVNKKDILDKNINDSGVYFASMIDRFPLLFHTNYQTAFVSKYYYLKYKEQKKENTKLILILMNNIFTIQNLETFLKDGTKRTHRKNENGFAKEISKTSLNKILIPNILSLNKQQKLELIEIYDRYSIIQMNSLDIALNNKDYLLLQLKIKKFLKLECNLEDVIENTKTLYFKRMRNLKKLNIKIEL